MAFHGSSHGSARSNDMNTPVPLSVVLITFNEAAKIADAITSARFADEVLVIDSGSTDDTAAIAQRLGARVVQREWHGFGNQKQFAVDSARHDWVCVLDSDERIPAELQNEIRRALRQPVFQAYRIARRNFFFGKFIRHGGLYPDYSVRLFHRRHSRFTGAAVHEKVVTTGPVGSLKEPMIHLAYDDIAHFITKANRYSSLSGQRNLTKAVFNPLWTFFNMYVLRLGFLDGKEGFLIAVLYSQYTFWKYLK